MPKPEDWLKFSESDLRTAKLILQADEGLLSTALYHIQQCVEKSLKAYLLFKNVPIQKTHDLLGLVERCAKMDIDFLSILPDAVDINPYSTTTRYPDDYYVFPSLDTAYILLMKAEAIYRFVEDKIFAND
jgi:HEPN domain-containing protein